jgi:hypothetical protein
VDAITQLLMILSVLSGGCLILVLVTDLIERLSAYGIARPRRGRMQRSPRRGRTNRPRRRRQDPDAVAAWSARAMG